MYLLNQPIQDAEQSIRTCSATTTTTG